MNDGERGVLADPLVAKFALAFLAAATALVFLQALSVLDNFGESVNGAENVVTVSGEGKVSAAPDLATISFTVSENGATAAAAQGAAAEKENAALAALKPFSIAAKDIQTSSYSVYPRYASPEPCVYAGASGPSIFARPCPPQEQKIIGYTASQTVTLKVRALDAVGDIATALGAAGVSNLSGPNFSIENPDAVKAAARDKAIADARAKAAALAKALGVRLVRVTNYSEGGGGFPGPFFAESRAAGAASAAVPQIPAGENEVDVTVSVTYEIR